MKQRCVYLALLTMILSACQISGIAPQSTTLPPSKTTSPSPLVPKSSLFTQIPESLDTPVILARTPAITPLLPTRPPSPTPPPAGIFALEFYPPLVLVYSTEQWIDNSEYNNTDMMVNYLQNIELTTCTIGPMGASGFFPDNMQEIKLGSIPYQILLNQSLTNGNVANYYFAFISYKGTGENLPGLPHFVVQSSSTESEKCRVAAEVVLATLQSPDQTK